MKTFLAICSIILLHHTGFSQNVGIGTVSPQDKLHVVGNARITGNVGIGTVPDIARKLTVGGGAWVNGLLEASSATIAGSASVGSDLLVTSDGIFGGNVRVNGRIGINGPTNSNYGLIVNDANTYLDGTLRVISDAIVDGNTRINGRIGINGPTNGNYGLIVNNANTYLQGNTTVTGSSNLQGPVSIQGKGSVRSDGTSSLRVGFSTGTFHDNVGGKESKTFNIPIASFNDVSDVRVAIAQVVSTGSGNDPENIPLFTWYVSSVNPLTNTCTIKVTNTTGLSKLLSAHFHVMAIAKD